MTNITPSEITERANAEAGARRGRGRPKDPDAMRFEEIGLRPAARAYLDKWRPGQNLTTQINDLIEQAVKFWPEGPDRFGHKAKKAPKKRLPMAFVREYAEQHGLRVEDAPAVALREFMQIRKEAGK